MSEINFNFRRFRSGAPLPPPRKRLVQGRGPTKPTKAPALSSWDDPVIEGAEDALVPMNVRDLTDADITRRIKGWRKFTPEEQAAMMASVEVEYCQGLGKFIMTYLRPAEEVPIYETVYTYGEGGITNRHRSIVGTSQVAARRKTVRW